jgi:hypothetical protein
MNPTAVFRVVLCALLLAGCATTAGVELDRTRCASVSTVAKAGSATIDLGNLGAGLATFWWPVGLIALGAQGVWWAGAALVCLAMRPSPAEVSASPADITDDGWGWEIPFRLDPY